MSGMTTTGASVLTDVEELSRSILMWRQFSQWIGGMGIIVLALAVLPRLRVGGRQLMESELPGPEVEKLTASIRTVARRLWLLYLGLTVALVLALASVGWAGADPLMDFYEAVAHAFTTMPTGGFGTRATSLEGFAPATQWILAAFMIVAGANFALLYRAFRRLGNPFRDEEFRLYLAILVLASAALVAKLIGRGIYEGEEAVRHAVFQVSSMMTTTGFASADFNEWPIFAAMILVALMFVGGSAGSTAGAIKVVRILILGRILRRDLDQTVHREAIVPIRMNGTVIEERTVRAIGAFVLLYLVVFLLGLLALVISEAVNSARLDLGGAEAISATATTLGNVGPGLGFLGPFGSFATFADSSKAILVVLMWMGRLELLPVLLLLTRSYWRR
jgi:trk system potassium uptake protein TrkH